MDTKILLRMIEYFGSDLRRINHTLKVYSFACALSGGLDGGNRDTLILAAIMHDIGIKNAELKYNSSSGEYQEIEGPPIAREILSSEGVAPDIIDRVCYLVGNHHSYDKISGTDFQLLVEADFLVNFYEDHLPSGTVRIIKDKYFKSPSGLRTVMDIYGV
jgi:HD superfamily phosphodiesterase